MGTASPVRINSTAARESRITPAAVGTDGAGRATQRQTTLIWDRATGKPIANAGSSSGLPGGGRFAACSATGGRRLAGAPSGPGAAAPAVQPGAAFFRIKAWGSLIPLSRGQPA